MPTSAVTSYSKYIERLRDKDPDVLLGSLFWYAVSENTRVKHADLTAFLQSVGLDGFAPPKPRDEDVFRRVCTSHQRKKVETDTPDVYENYMVRDVKRGPDVFTKQIVVERVNGKGKKLGYVPAVQLEYVASANTLEIDAIGRANGQAMNLAELIRRDFKTDKGRVNAYGIRELLRKIVMSTGALCVKSTGGIYFILESERATLDALVAFAANIPTVSVHPVPLINDAEQQRMLKEAFEAETKGAVEERLAEIDALLEGPEITARRYSDLHAEMLTLQSKTEPYRELLDDTLANTDLVLGSLKAKMQKLFQHVKGE